jgi:hypothetical protein
MYANTPINHTKWMPQRTFSVAGAIVAGVGTLLGVLSLTVFTWIEASNGIRSRSATFSDLHDVFDRYQHTAYAAVLDNEGLRVAYFSWLCWLLLVVGAIAAFVAVSPAGNALLRLVGFVVAAFGLGLTLYVPADNDRGYASALGEGRLGFWGTLACFVLLVIAVLIGPGHRSVPVLRETVSWAPAAATPTLVNPNLPSSAVSSAYQPLLSVQTPTHLADHASRSDHPTSSQPWDGGLATAAPPQAAQWSPDPTGRHQMRYHDGHQWTAHVSTYGVTRVDPL